VSWCYWDAGSAQIQMKMDLCFLQGVWNGY